MNGTTTSTIGDTLFVEVQDSTPLLCDCCGSLDDVTPCHDCVAYCPETEWCKAGGVAKLRMRIARVLRGAVNRWLDPRDWSNG